VSRLFALAEVIINIITGAGLLGATAWLTPLALTATPILLAIACGALGLICFGHAGIISKRIVRPKP
jgi:hypothetical protein